ncbi:hypothetical protein [Planktothrix tepida]|nr:hypothetical protein [Planktothrix tepida]
MVYDNQNMQWFLKIDNYDGIPNRVKWLPGTPNLKIVEIPSIKPRQKSNTPTRTPVMDECCEETKEMINDIYEMLGGDDFLEKGIEIPNHLFIPGGKDDTQALTYNAILNILFRTLDHRTCGEVEVSIADNNIMKEGDQPLTMKFINNTAATGKIIELSQKQNSDLVAVLNLLMRLSWISVQLLKLINLINGTVNAITKFLDVPIREKIENVETPFDISLGQKVGFDQKKPSEDQLIKTLDLDNPEKTLSILDKFMNNAKIPLKIKTFIGTKEGGNFWWMMNKKG